MAVHVGGIQDCSISLCLFLAKSLDFVHYVVKVENAHVFLQLLNVSVGPAFKDVITTTVDDRAISEAAHAASSIEALNDLLVAEDGALWQILQLVSELPGGLTDRPPLKINGVSEVAIQLYDGLHDELAAADHIEGHRVLPDIIDRGTFSHFQLI